MHRVLARQRLGVVAFVVRRLDQRAQADPDRAHVGTRRRFRQVAAGLAEDEVHLLAERCGLAVQVVARRVGGAEDRLAQPRHGEEHAAVGRLRHHQRMRAGHEGAVDDEVHALARRHHRGARRCIGLAVHVAHRVHPHAGGVDHAARAQREGFAAFGVLRVQAAHLAVFAQQPGDGDMVQHQRAALRRGARQQQRQPRVVELPVPVLDAADQPRRAHRGQQFARAAGRQPLGRPQALPPGEHVVHLQPGAVEGHVEHAVARHDEGHALRHVRRVGQQGAALVQRLAHQADVALRHVAHAAVHQLGGARRGALGEVLAFQQHRRETPRRGVQRDAQAGGATADDRQVPDAGFAQPRQQRAAFEHAVVHRFKAARS